MSSSETTTPLLTIGFIGLCLAVLLGGAAWISFSRFQRMAGMSRRKFAAGITILELTVLSALLLLPAHGTSDENIFLHWIRQLSQHGIVETYAEHHSALNPREIGSQDYPPLAYVILDPSADLTTALNFTPRLGLKLTLALFVCLSCFVLWEWIVNPVALAALSALLLIDAMVYGYLDVLFMPTLLLALATLQKNKYTLGASLFGISCLIKWQPLILAPFIVIYIVWNDTAREFVQRIHWKRVLTALVIPATVGVILLVFFFGATPFLSFQAATANVQLSGQALNAEWVLTFLLRALDPQQFGNMSHPYIQVIKTLDWRVELGPKILFALFYLIAVIYFLRGPKTFERLIQFSMLGFLAYFVFNTGVHENHLFVAAFLGILMWHLSANTQTLALFWTILFWVNVRLFYAPNGALLTTERVVDGIDPALPLAVFVTLFFVYFFIRTIRNDGKQIRARELTALKHATAI